MTPEVYAIIIAPILTLFLGALLNRLSENRPRLLTYIGHIFAIKLPDRADAPGVQVHTHSVVIRNAGRRPARNVRVGHNFLPNYQILPQIQHEVVDLPGGGKEILIPTLVPREQITVNYLYYPPVIWSNINTSVKSDDGIARTVNVLLTRQYGKAVQAVSAILLLLGMGTFVYWIVRLVALIVA